MLLKSRERERFKLSQSSGEIYTCPGSRPGRAMPEAGALRSTRCALPTAGAPLSTSHVADTRWSSATFELWSMPLLPMGTLSAGRLGVSGRHSRLRLSGWLPLPLPRRRDWHRAGKVFYILGRACGRSPRKGVSPLLPMLRAHHRQMYPHRQPHDCCPAPRSCTLSPIFAAASFAS